MKKLTLLATMFAALTFASCGESKGEGDNTDTTVVAEDTTTTEAAPEVATEDTTATADTTTVAE